MLVDQRRDAANLLDSQIGQRPHFLLEVAFPQAVFQVRCPDPDASGSDAGPVP